MLLLENEQPIHLEIIYKFYLYDATNNKAKKLDAWVGPNRSDALVYKLKKLKEKQLPLLYHPITIEILNHYNLDINIMRQKVCFKAQLFLPYHHKNIDIAPLNSNCVNGWHLSFTHINELENFEFYIPKKTRMAV